jgi:hypothetical protein
MQSEKVKLIEREIKNGKWNQGLGEGGDFRDVKFQLDRRNTFKRAIVQQSYIT